MKRGKPLQASLEKLQAWQRRSQQSALERVKCKPKQFARRVRQRRNDAPWRVECLAQRGLWCRVPGCPHPQPVQMDHIIPRAHGGPSVVENGLPLCRHHHRLKTEHLLLIDPSWLDEDQVEWLADQGHAEWLLDGVVVGRHRRLFTDGPDLRPDSPSVRVDRS